MTFTRRTFTISLASAGIVSASVAAFRATAQDTSHGAHHSTPEGSPEAQGCVVPSASPGATPEATIPYDQAYIDMMIPHHESIIALAEVAVTELEDDRLVAIAQAILDTQAGEIDELKALREEWYGDPEPAMMSDEIMAVSMGMQHGCADQGHMDQMGAEWQLEQFAAAEDKDLAFIDALSLCQSIF